MADEKRSTEIVIVASVPETKLLHEALNEIKREHGEIVHLTYYSVAEIDEERRDKEIFINDLIRADIVLMDIMSQQKCAKMVEDVLATTRNTVITLFSASSSIWKLTRLGSFDMRNFGGVVEYDLDSTSVESEVKKGVKIRGIIERLGSVLPIGMLRDGRNWATAIRYWEYGGKDNLKNLLLFVTKNYGKCKTLKPGPPYGNP